MSVYAPRSSRSLILAAGGVALFGGPMLLILLGLALHGAGRLLGWSP